MTMSGNLTDSVRLARTMLSTSDEASGVQLPARVHTYIEALVRTCSQDGALLVSVVLFGSAAKGGFAGDVSDVDLIIVVPVRQRMTSGPRLRSLAASRPMGYPMALRLQQDQGDRAPDTP
jgi:tRNA nucleotidyltransferase (CCA-adding enzyme)